MILPAHGKGAHQAGKIIERHFVREQDAGEARGIQQLCETALGLTGFERYAIEQKFIVGDAQHKTSVSGLGQGVLQLLPGDFKLTVSAFVVGSIQPRVLNEDVETVKERPRRRATSGIGLNGVRDNILLLRWSHEQAYAGTCPYARLRW
jgi:hypothetical protein